MDIPVDPETNKPIEPFKAAVDRLWMAEDDGVKFGEFGATDLAPYIKAVESDIQHLAAWAKLSKQAQLPLETDVRVIARKFRRRQIVVCTFRVVEAAACHVDLNRFSVDHAATSASNELQLHFAPVGLALWRAAHGTIAMHGRLIGVRCFSIYQLADYGNISCGFGQC
jgi:hypothetical protein